MIPDFDENGLLPTDSTVSLAELRASHLVTGDGVASDNWDSAWRQELVDKVEQVFDRFMAVGGIREFWIDGSFVELVDHPGDIDVYFTLDDPFDWLTLADRLNALEGDPIWTWDPANRKTYPGNHSETTVLGQIQSGCLPGLWAAVRHPGCPRQLPDLRGGIPTATENAPAEGDSTHKEGPMIRSEAEYRKAKEDYERLVPLLAAESEHWVEQGLTDAQAETMLNPMRLRMAELEERIELYERVRAGDLSMFQSFQEVGKALIAARLAKGLSQREFAEIVGVHESQVSRDERNEYHGVRRERLDELLLHLGLRFEGHFRLGDVIAHPRLVLVEQPAVYLQAAGLALDAEEIARELTDAVA